MNVNEELRTAVNGMLDELEGPAGDCPSEESLIDYCARKTSEDTAGAVRSHLLHCGRCRETLAEVEVFLAAVESRAGVPATDGEWASFARRLAPAPSRLWSWWPHGLAAVAAMVTIAVGLSLLGERQTRTALLAENRQLRQSIEMLNHDVGRFRQPQANVLAYDVFPSGAPTRAAGAVSDNVLPAPADKPVTWMLIGNAIQCDPCAVEVFERTPDGRERSRWRAENVERDAHGNLVIAFPARFLVAAKYLVRVSASRNEAGQPIAEYHVQTQ